MPALSRTTDPETSHEAGHRIARHSMIVKDRVLSLFRAFHRLTDYELTEGYMARFGKCPESTPRKRRCDLVEDNLIRDSGVRVHIPTGSKAIVWELVSIHAEQESLSLFYRKGNDDKENTTKSAEEGGGFVRQY